MNNQCEKKVKIKHHKYQQIFSLALIMLLILTSFPFNARASKSLNLKVYEISILEQDNFHIKGSFDLISSHNTSLESLRWSFQLYSRDNEQSNLVFEKNTNFSINQMQRKNVEFNVTYPHELLLGQYFFYIKIYDDSGMLICMGYKNIGTLGTYNEFLVCDYNNSFFLLQNSEKVSIGLTPYYKPNISPELKLAINNPSGINREIQAFAQIFTRSPEFDPNPVFDNKIGSFNLQSEPKTDFSLKLPQISTPESYFAKISLKDNSGAILCNIIEVRYVVEKIAAKFIVPKLQHIKNVLVFDSIVAGSPDVSKISGVNLTIKGFLGGQITPIKIIEKTLTIEKEPIPISIEMLDLNKYPSQEIDYKVKAILSYNNITLDSYENVYTRTPQEEKTVFKDIVGTESEQFVMPLYKMGLISGFEDNTFRPNEKFTRAQFAAMVCNLEKINDLSEYHTNDNVFFDVTQKYWAVSLINLVKSLDLMNGYPDGSFKPDAYISFAEMVTFLVRWIEKDDGINKKLEWPFNYVKRSDELRIAVSSNYDIRGPITRGKMSEIFLSAIQIK